MRATPHARRLHHDVVETLVGKIVGGELPPGTFLPSEAELSLQLSVSRTVVREALRVLAAKGLVEIRHGAGSVVSSADAWDPLDAVVLAARRERGAMLAVLQDLLEARRIFECEVAALAADRCGPHHLEALGTALAKMRDSLDAPAEFMRGDAAFHRTLLEATDNQVLMRMLEPVRELIRFSMQTTDSLGPLLIRALGEHTAIYRAVKRGEPEAARRAMRRHLTHTERDLHAILGRDLRRNRRPERVQ